MATSSAPAARNSARSVGSMRSIGQRATSAWWVSWSMRACSVTAAVRSARKCARSGLGKGHPVDLRPQPVRLELLEHRLEPGVRRLHLEERLHRVEARGRAHAAGLGGGEARLGGVHSRVRHPEAALAAAAAPAGRSAAPARSGASPPRPRRRPCSAPPDRRAPPPGRGSRRSGCRCRCRARRARAASGRASCRCRRSRSAWSRRGSRSRARRSRRTRPRRLASRIAVGSSSAPGTSIVSCAAPGRRRSRPRAPAISASAMSR